MNLIRVSEVLVGVYDVAKRIRLFICGEIVQIYCNTDNVFRKICIGCR